MPHRTALLIALILCISSAPAFAADPIRVVNYKPGEVVRYPVALLVGELDDKAHTDIALNNLSSKRPTTKMKGLALNGRFKVLAELVPGENRMLLAAGKSEQLITLNYKPQSNPYFVRMIYMTDSTGDTAYQSQKEGDPQDFAAKLDTAMKLMQTMTAERMHDLGYGRRTFNLELDDNGKVKVHVHKGAKPASEYYKIDDQAWYREVSKEMNAAFDMKFAKNIVIASYTRWDPVAKKPYGHTALGGGNQGLFGSGNVFTWPSTLADVQPAFMDARKMDTGKVQDDSAGRGTFWGAASTTIGATLHEMGHAFGLPHTTVGIDIMTRGFDHFNRVFTFSEPSRRNPGTPRAFKPEEAAAFAPISAESLLTSRWFAMDERKYAERNDITITYDAGDDSIVVKSPTGVRYFSASIKGDAVFHKSPPLDKPAPAEMRIPVTDIRKAVAEGDPSFHAANADGHVGRASLDRIKRRAEEKGKGK